jgi:hypothetical protein
MATDSTSGTPPDYYNKSSANVVGAVYAVAGTVTDTSGVVPGWPHPAMYTYLDTVSGSLVIDVNGDTLDVKFLTLASTIADHFSILKHNSTVSISEAILEPGKLLLYPDPVNSNLTIQYIGKNDEKLNISIINSLGHLVKSKDIQGKYYLETFDVSELTSGVYFITMKGKRTNIVNRFIKY